MTDNVVVAISGSGSDEIAISVGAIIARSCGATLHLLHAASPDRHAAMRERLAARAASLDLSAHVSVSDGDPAIVLVDAAARLDDSIVCIAARGPSSVRELIRGSVPGRVIATSVSPVLVVGPKVPIDDTRAGPLIVCIDDTEDSEAILAPTAELATALKRAITLVEVVAPEEGVEMDDVPDADTDEDTATTRGQQRLDEIATQLREMGVETAGTHVLHGSVVSDAIARYAEEQDAFCIALATEALTGLHRLLHGSTASNLISRATSPVLTVRFDS